jgi:ABC-type branched-subunit amino acid transport system substrate-binding protein
LEQYLSPRGFNDLAGTSKNAKTGVWIAIIIIIAILAAYGGYYSGFENGLKRTQQSPQGGPGASPTTLPSIKVGVIVSNVSHAPDVLHGVRLARDLLNNRSDATLRNVTLSIKYLEREDPERVKNFVRSFINEGIRVVIGALSNSEVKAVLQMLHENDTILVLVSNEAYDDAVYDDPRVVKMLGGPDVEARAMVDLALEVGKEGLSAAIIAAKDPYCLRLANAINEFYSLRGGHIVSKVLYELGRTNIMESLVNVSNLRPAIIFFVGQKGDAPAILEAAHSVGLNATWILSGAMANDLLNRRDLVYYLTGSYIVMRWNVTLSPRFKEFAELYRRVYQEEPHEMAVYGFDSLMLTTLSSAYAGKYNGSAVKGVMDVLCDFIGITWPKFLDSKGNVVQEHDILRVVEGGRTIEAVGRWVPTDAKKARIEWLRGS